jgi:hypothetical protein
MIELNSKTQQDFLNREWVQRLLDAGVDMSDAYYGIGKDKMHGNRDKIFILHMWGLEDTESFIDKIPTYTVSELLYKLHEWIYPTIDGKEYSGGLKVSKDAPFYFAYYDLKNREGKEKTEKFYAEAEYPIESLAMLLIQCHKKDIGIEKKDTGDISDK